MRISEKPLPPERSERSFGGGLIVTLNNDSFISVYRGGKTTMKKRSVSLFLSLAVLAGGAVGVSAEDTTVASRTVTFDAALSDAEVAASADISSMLEEDSGGNKYLTLTKEQAVTLTPQSGGAAAVLSGGRYITVSFKIAAEAKTGCMSVVPIFSDSDGKEITDKTWECSLWNKTLTMASTAKKSIDTKTFYSVEYVFDTTANTYEILYQGERMTDSGADDYTFELTASPAVSGIAGVELQGTNNKKAWIDDIAIKVWNKADEGGKDPEPTPTPTPTPTPDPEPGTDPDPTPTPGEADEELKYSYDFESDIVGKLPQGKGIEARLSGGTTKKEDYFTVVTAKDINGADSKMLKITQRADSFTDYNRIVLPTGDIEGEILEFSYDVKLDGAAQHVGASPGILDYERDAEGTKTSHLEWGKGTVAMARYSQNWYFNGVTSGGNPPQWYAPSGSWSHVRCIVNTVKGTMMIYPDTTLNGATDYMPLPKYSSKTRIVTGIEGFEISVSKDTAQKQSFDAYFDNFKLYKRAPLVFTAKNGTEDLKTDSLSLEFTANKEFTKEGSVTVSKAGGEILESTKYTKEITQNGVKLTFKSPLEKKTSYTVTLSGFEYGDKLPMSDAYSFTFLTEPESYDVTYSVTADGAELTDLSAARGKTLSITAANRNYQNAAPTAYITFAALISPKNQLISAKTVDLGELKTGEKSTKTISFAVPDQDLAGCRLKLMTWDTMKNGNILFENYEIK